MISGISISHDFEDKLHMTSEIIDVDLCGYIKFANNVNNFVYLRGLHVFWDIAETCSFRYYTRRGQKITGLMLYFEFIRC